MSRATSASLYGSKAPVDVSRMPARRAPRAYGLRSESAPSGWYSAGARPSKPRPRRNGPVVSNKPKRDPAVQAELDRLARIAAMEAAEDDARAIRDARAEDRIREIMRAHAIGNID